MAMSEKTVRYTPGMAVNGSAAYDLKRAGDPEYFDYEGTAAPELTDEPEVELEAEPQRSARRHAAAEERTQLRPMILLGFLGIIFLSVMVVLANARLTMISTETVKLHHTIEELKKENGILQIKYENTFDLNQIEAYATKKLGMTRLHESQIRYIGSCGADKAEILNGGDRAAFFSVLSELGSVWKLTKAYFSRG